MARVVLGAGLLCLGAQAKLDPYTTKLGDELWKKAEKQVEKMGKGTYESNTNFVCGVGTWGDGPQCNQWDQGRSPCWPSAMTVSATWDTEVMELWSREMAQEFGGPGRGQLGPGINVVRFPWNGRAGEYMAGEDPYFGAQMVATMVRACRKAKDPPLQVAKHFIPNTIEKDRNSITEEVDERTLFEVYYPPFDAAVEAGVAGMMCSYNLVKCTTGRCSNKGVYACASSDVLNDHLKDIMGFKGMVISDWDATKCQDDAASSPGCTQGGYIDNAFAAEGGLDLEMPDCMSFGGGVTERAKEKAVRMQWSYLVQNQTSPAVGGRRLGEANTSSSGKTLKWGAQPSKCFQVSWDGDDSTEEGMQVFLSDCAGNSRQRFSWSKEDKKIHWATHPELCIGVADEKLKEKKPNLRMQKCEEEKGQDFKMFSGSKGTISSVANPKLCITPAYQGVTLTECGGEDQEVLSRSVRDTGAGKTSRSAAPPQIHHVDAPGAYILASGERCLQAGKDGGTPYNGLKVVFEKCSAAAEQRWLWYAANSTIRVASHPGMCVDVTNGNYEQGTHLQIWECVDGNKNQVFQMFNDTGKLRTFKDAEVCVKPAEEDWKEMLDGWDSSGAQKDKKKKEFAKLAKCSSGETFRGVSFKGAHGEEDKPMWMPFHANKAPISFTKSLEKSEESEEPWAWTPPAPAPETPGAAPQPSWHTGVYDWKTDNPFGATNTADDASSSDELKAAETAMADGPDLENACPDAGEKNYDSKCKLALANRIIAEAAVVLKNEGGVLPLSASTKVALVGEESCSTSPLAQGGGSGWNGFSCNQVPKVNVQQGIKALKFKNGVDLPCPDDGDDNSLAKQADVVLIVVVPEKAEEGRDRSTLQLHGKDTKLIQKYSKLGKKVVVVINAPGPMILSTWDDGVDAIVITWLPGQQNGNGIAMALYNEGYGASGRLPFTFPKCKTKACSKADEFDDATALLGGKVKNKEYAKFTEKALIGYRWYQAKGMEVSYPFGFGLFNYGAAKVEYAQVSAMVVTGHVEVSSMLSQSAPDDAKDVPQLYISFPDSVPGDKESKPEWVLKGFTKVLLKSNFPTKVTFRLSQRDLSYWDDGKGKSKWVCVEGTFRACVGANANDAVNSSSSCTTFQNVCAAGDAKSSAVPLDAFIGAEDTQVGHVAAAPQALSSTAMIAAVGLLASLGLVQVVRRQRKDYSAVSAGAAPLAEPADELAQSDA